MSKPTVLAHQNCLLMWRADVADDAATVLNWFDPSNPALLAQAVLAGGRGAAWFVRAGRYQAVLKRYRRGGMMGRVNPDLYGWTTESALRPFHEYDVLHTLVGAGLPVATPLAAFVQRVAGLLYRGALITQRIEGARSLADCRDEGVWYVAGQTLRQLHQFGAWHADLNVHNILVDPQNKIWLIDFDKARLDVRAPALLAGNLSRLQRSMHKVCPWAAGQHWSALRQGYDSGGSDPIS
jgi:3-deoxy-D-manno-octulosonic acid kinase